MLRYRPELKQTARKLRKHMTDSERILWSRLRGKQLCSIQFYRQKPIGNYIVDFYGPGAKLVVEIDGSQHFTPETAKKDQIRDDHMKREGLEVLRFSSRAVLKETDAVMAKIHRAVLQRIGK